MSHPTPLRAVIFTGLLLATTATASSAQLEIVTGMGLNGLALPTNCFAVPEQHAPGPTGKPVFNAYDWKGPIAVFAPNRGAIWLATNTITDWANLFSSNPAILQVPSQVHLKTEESYNHETTSSYELTTAVRAPTPVTVTAASTKNPGRKLERQVVVYPQFTIDSVYFSRTRAFYEDQTRVTLVVQLPWGLPDYLSAFDVELHRPAFEWRGTRYEMDVPEWGGEETIRVTQASGDRRLQKMFKLVLPKPDFATPVERIQWRRQRDVELTMDVRLIDRSGTCELVKGDGAASFRFTMRNPDYSHPRGG